MIIFKKSRNLDNRYDISEIEMKVDAESLSDVLEEFKHFLQACGYTVNGELEVVEEVDRG